VKQRILLLLTLFSLRATAQTITPEEALAKRYLYPIERVSLRTDKEDYLAGETIFYKAFVFSGSGLSRISTNLYVELLDANKKSRYQMLLPLVGGVAQGSINLPKDLPENIYYLRTYTSWMLNFDQRFQQLQPLAIYNPNSNTRLIANDHPQWTATIHPEGNILLEGVETDVAVRLHSTGSLPEKWSGYVYEGADSSNVVAEFSSLNSEVSLFPLIPVTGKSYHLRIRDNLGRSSLLDLPAVATTGIALKTARVPQGIIYEITAKGASLQGCQVLAHTGSTVLYSGIIPADSKKVSAVIPVDSSVQGLVHLTLFGKDGAVLAERLSYPRLPSVSAPQVAYRQKQGKRGFNDWALTVDTLRSDTWAVSVVAANEQPKEEKFLSALWLNELTQLPALADWYFRPGNRAAPAALDAWLLTASWDLFQWPAIRKKPEPVLTYFPDYYLSYTGVASLRGQAVRREPLTILVFLADSSRVVSKVTTDSIGRFRLRKFFFPDTAKVFYHINSQPAAPLELDLRREEFFLPYDSLLPATSFTLVPRKPGDSLSQKVKAYQTVIGNQAKLDEPSIMMQAVVVKAKTKSPTQLLNNKLSTPMFRDPGETVLDFMNEDQDMGGSTILEYLVGKVPGVMSEGTDGISIRGQSPQIYIDEFQSDIIRLNSIPYTEIAMVKVIRNSFMVGGGGPVVSVYTKRADMYPGNQPNAPKLTFKKIAGYPVPANYRVLLYNSSESAKMPNDARSVLYWNPTLKPEAGLSPIQFQASDAAASVWLVVLGFDNKGKPVYLRSQVGL
jgi:hypothetical protein